MHQGFEQSWLAPIIRAFGKQRYLLAALMALLVFLPVLSSDDVSPLWITMLLMVIMLAGPLSLATNAFDFYFSLLLGVLMTSTSWIEEFFPQYQVISGLTTMIFFLTLSVLIFRQHLMFRFKSSVTGETLLAAVNAYICMGIMYAFAYFYLLKVNPSAFTGTFMEGGTVAFEACVYLSFVTMTTLGYGDITPQIEIAGVLTWTQALIGQLFIAIAIARIVSGMMANDAQ